MEKIILISFMVCSIIYAAAPTKPYPEREIGEMVKLGEDIINNTDTHPLTKELVNNKLKCVSCHLSGEDGHPGSTKNVGTFVDVATRFPLYKKREGVVETLQDRIDNCFMRSMDGTRPIIDSEASVAMLTYITWLSDGKAINLNSKTNGASEFSDKVKTFTALQKKASNQNYKNGKEIYKNQCTACHGSKGEGVATFPPLWGKSKDGKWLSYNAGAGMSKLDKSAVWIQSNMPLGAEGSLSDQQSADVALYINAQERGSFDLAAKLLKIKNMGYYNSKILKEKDTTESNFKALGLEIKKIIKE